MMLRQIRGLAKNYLGRQVAQRRQGSSVLRMLSARPIQRRYSGDTPSLVWRGIQRRTAPSRQAPSLEMLERLRERTAGHSANDVESGVITPKPAAQTPPRRAAAQPAGRPPLTRTAVELPPAARPVAVERAVSEPEIEVPSEPSMMDRIPPAEQVTASEPAQPELPHSATPNAVASAALQKKPEDSSAEMPAGAKLATAERLESSPNDLQGDYHSNQPIDSVSEFHDVSARSLDAYRAPSAEERKIVTSAASESDATAGSWLDDDQQKTSDSLEARFSETSFTQPPLASRPTGIPEQADIPRQSRAVIQASADESGAASDNVDHQSVMHPASSETVEALAPGLASSLSLPGTVHVKYRHRQPAWVARKPINTIHTVKSEITSVQRFDLAPEYQRQEHDDLEDSGRGSSSLREFEHSTSGERGMLLGHSGQMAVEMRNGSVQRSPDQVSDERKKRLLERELPVQHPGTSRDGSVAAPLEVEPAAGGSISNVTAVQRAAVVGGEPGSASPVATPTIGQRADEVAAPVKLDASSTQNAPAQSAPAVDVDSMAREVYQIISRRLRVEHERARGWSG